MGLFGLSLCSHSPRLSPLCVTQLSVLQEQPKRDVPDGTSPTLSTSSAATLSPPGLSNSPLSCPGTPTTQHARQGCPSPGGTLKRPPSLSRHASAAGFPLQSWVFSKGYPKGAQAQSPSLDSQETVCIEVEDIPLLLRDVARFAEAVEKLKDVVLGEGEKERRLLLPSGFFFSLSSLCIL